MTFSVLLMTCLYFLEKSWSIIQKCADKLDADCNLQADNRHLWRRVDADVFEKITK